MESRMDQYEIMEQIGRGAFGAAILVNHKVEKKRYVLKKIRLARQTERCRRSAHQEMALIARIRHPFIVEYKEAWVEKGCYVCIVTGYCEGGDMAEMIKRLGEDVFPEEKLLKWFTQLLLAVEYLHSNFVLHRDLKCSNIFLTKEQDVRLGDFGLAKTLKADDLASSVVGTPNYMCPELLADIPYGFKSDIWSLGCCMYEMAAHRPAFKAFDMAGLISKINRSAIGPIPVCYSSSLKSLIKSMLRKNPEHRPSASEILRHPCIQPYIKQYTTSGPIKVINPPNTQERLSESQTSRSSISDKDKVPDQVKTHEIELKQPRSIKNILMALKEENKPRSKSSPLRRNQNVNPSLPSKVSEPAISSGSSSLKSNSDVSPKEKKHILPPPLEPNTNSKPGQRPPAKDIPRPLTTAARFLQKPPEVNKMIIPPTVSDGPTLKNLPEAEKPNKTPVINEQPNKNLPEAMELSFPSSDQEFVAMDEPELVSSSSSLKPKIMTSTFDEVIHVIRHSSFRVAGDEKPSSSESIHSKEEKEEEEEDSKEILDKKSFRQRAEALEELLELSAELLQDNRLEELAVVLRPFGKDKVSPRETAIWLAKSLKSMKMDDPNSSKMSKKTLL